MFGRGLYVEPGEEFFDEVLSAFSPQPLKELYGHGIHCETGSYMEVHS